MTELGEPTEDDLADWIGSEALTSKSAVTPAPPATPATPAPSEDEPEYADAIPDLDEPEYDNSKYDFAKEVPILQIYATYCGKMEPKVGSRRESVMVSCPVPEHIDAHPSAYLNLDKNLWHCAACGVGGDGLDIARMSLGYALDDRRSSGFAETVKRVAEDFGFVEGFGILPTAPPAPEPTPAPVGEPVVAPAEAVIPPSVVVRDFDEDIDYGKVWLDFSHAYDWQDFYSPNGFRSAYMTETAIGRLIPHEFHACMADQLLGLAAGRKVVKREGEAVYANTYACLLGPTGIGKSRAMRPARAIINELLAHDSLTGTGVKVLNKPGSGEVLISEMDFQDPTSIDSVPQVGWLNMDELADVVARSARKGSTLQTTIVEFFSATDSAVTTSALSSGTRIATKPFLSIVSGTQPAVLPRLLSDDDLASGFLNRFMFYVATRPAMPGGYSVADGDPVYELRASMAAMHDIVNWLEEGSSRYRTGQIEVVYTDDAKSAVADVYKVEDLIGVPYERDPIFARLELIFKKLMLLNAVDDCRFHIDPDNVARAYRQLQYFVSAYSFTAHSMMESETEKCLAKLIDVVTTCAKDPKWASGVPVGQVRKRFKDTKYMDLFDKVMAHAIATSSVRCYQSKPGPGRPTQVLLPG